MKNRIYVLWVFLASTLVSCEDWFEVKPENQVNDLELFSTGEGYRNELNGAYLELSDASLYGQELTWGFLDILGQSYIENRLKLPYTKVSQLFYGDVYVKPYIENIWKNSFHVVANCNRVLSNIAKEPDSKFEWGNGEKSLIEGEALALRAFVHFDLFRLFGPSPRGNDKAAYVPYVKEYGSVINNPLVTAEFLDNVVKDLLDAKRLVGSYDTVYPNFAFVQSVIPRLEEGGSGVEEEYPLFLINRGYRMNYYAVTALLARVYSYMGLSEKANEQANEVCNALDINGLNCFDFTYSWEVSGSESGRNRKLYTDVILAFRNPELPKLFEPYMYSTRGTLALRNLDKIFDGASDSQDFRFKYLTKTLGSETRRVSIKNIKGEDNTLGSRISRVLIPIIRLSEMHYIRAEYMSRVDLSQAVAILENLRTIRGEIKTLREITDTVMFQKALLNDARREFIGEGQIFYMYKRLNLPVFDGLQEFDLKDKIKLPVPDSETVLL